MHSFISSYIVDYNFSQISSGLDHSLVLTNDGKIYSTGLGADGQTGDFPFLFLKK